MEYMQDYTYVYSNKGKLNVDGWIRNGERYILKLLREKPREAEMIRQVSQRVERTLLRALEVAKKAQEEVRS